MKLTWGSPLQSAILCRSSKAWFTCFSKSKAAWHASSPLPHLSFSGFYKRLYDTWNTFTTDNQKTLTTVIILSLKFSAGTDNSVCPVQHCTTPCPPAPQTLLIGLFCQDLLPSSSWLSSPGKELELTTNNKEDAKENHPEFLHMKQSHNFIAKIKMMGLR